MNISSSDRSQNNSQRRPSRSRSASASTRAIGIWAEALVVQWLKGQNWEILHRRWHCRWGEIDVIACLREPNDRSTLAFVEVKARSQGNWDADGLLAITPQKQAKLWQTAELFLSEFPDWANSPCRFDVALVKYSSENSSGTAASAASSSASTPNPDVCPPMPKVVLGQWIEVAGYRLNLHRYIANVLD